MDTIQIFKRAASLTWRYRLLWLFGFLLALTVITAPFWLPFAGDDDGELMENRIIFQATTVYFPGEGVTIDFRPPDGPVVTIEGLEAGEFRDLVKDVRLSDIWALLITIGVVILISLLLRLLLRYTSQAALIRMVDEHERSQRMVNLRGGLRLAWSRVAGRLFLIDLTIAVVLILVFSLLFALAISPFFLFGLDSLSPSVTSVVGISLLGLGGLSVFIFLAFVAKAILSITRRARWMGWAQDPPFCRAFAC